MNLVVGSTGIVGGEICRQLLAAGKEVRALVRSTSDPAKVERLRSLGAEIVVGDLRDKASLDAACRGVSAVLSSASAMPFALAPGNTLQTVDKEGHLKLIDSAIEAGAKSFTFVSATASGVPEHKLAVEERMRTCGLEYTILAPGVNMETWLSPPFTLDYVHGKATIFGSGEYKVSWISIVDVARFAVMSLDNPALKGARVELGGPEPLSPLEVVRIFEEEAGKAFEVTHVPEEALRAQGEAAANNPNANDLEKMFPLMALWITTGAEIDMTESLRLAPVDFVSVRDYARRVVPIAAKV